MAGHAFISYSRRDSDYVERLVSELELRGFKYFIDRGVEPGNEWIRVIKEKIETCSVFIAVVTDNSQKSEMVELEILHAKDCKKVIMPLLLDGRRHFLLRRLQDADVRTGELPGLAWFAELGRNLSLDAASASVGHEVFQGLELWKTFPGHSKRIRSVAWSPNGRLLASGGEDCRTLVRDVITGEISQQLSDHNDWVCAVSWAPAGRLLATAGGDRRVIVTEGAQIKTVLSGHWGNIVALAWSPDSRQIASASADGTVIVHRVSGEGQQHALTGHDDRVFSVSWSRSGRLATGSADGTVRQWDPVTGDEIGRPLLHEGTVRAVAWSPDSRRLATASSQPLVRVWDMQTATSTTLDHPAPVLALAWNDDGALLACGTEDGSTRVWEAASFTEVACVTEHQGSVRSVAWSPTRPWALATGGEDQIVRTWRKS